MRGWRALCALLALGAAPGLGDAVSVDPGSADIFLIGEIHDNPHHHRVQADLVAQIAPRAVVYEMLTPEQASRVLPDLIGDADALSDALAWTKSGWPDFAFYYPIFQAAPEAQVYGAALLRAELRNAMDTGVAGVFGPEVDLYGLTEPLPEDQQSAREALQHAAHCEALPPDLLPAMVEMQRLRDARLAQVAIAAHDAAGGPVVVITGNGHARRDWGMVPYLDRVRPDLDVFAIGQSEGNAVAGAFDLVISAPAIDRPDPCDAFRDG